MQNAPKFFVPAAQADTAEQTYASIAKTCGVAVPELSKRVYSISFRQDGEDWTATVGEQLSGTKHIVKGRGSKRTERSQGVSDPATVLAIFPGTPYVVFTTGDLTVRSRWANPFMANPSGVVHFVPAGDPT